MKYPLHSQWLLLLATACVFSLPAFSADDCASCSAPDFPQAEQLLASQGFAASDYEVLVAWEEAAPAQANTMLRGVRVRPRAGGDAQDLYFGPQNQLLTDADLRGLGVHPKDWTPQVAAAEAEPAPTAPAAKAAGVPLPLSAAAVASLPTVSLPAVDVAKARQEDAQGLAGLAKGVKRIGLVQDLSVPVRLTEAGASAGAWQELPDGQRLWAAVFEAQGALGQRLHLSQAALPEGARVVAYNAELPEERYAVALGAKGEGWTATCFSARVALEVVAPKGAGLRLSVDRAVYVYAGPAEWTWAKAAGSCNVDVSCYPEWADIAKGVGGLGSVGRLGYLWCTGTLLTDQDPQTNIPYFLTAHHCVGSQAEADSLEVYWLYQTPSCGGTPPAARSVPRTTGGADFLAGASYASGPDFALLRLRGDTPEGAMYAGWETEARTDGAGVVCVHHPRGDYKRISFGAVDVSATDGSGLPAARFYGVRWSLGVTEPGSSGSPLFDAQTQRFVGQLYGGGASCSSPNEPDYFGRFDQTFPLVQAYLADTLRLTRPNGGEYWVPGSEAQVEWFASEQLNGSVRVELLKNGELAATLAEGIDIHGSYAWRIPSDLPMGPNYSVAIVSGSKANLFDTSDSTFAVGPAVSISSVSPAGGSAEGGDAVEITGEGFEGGGAVTVSFGGAQVKDVVVVDNTKLRCTTPVHLPGAAAVSIRNAWGGAADLADGYVFNATAPLPLPVVDVNGDGHVNVGDIQRVVNAVLGGDPQNCDVNKDGDINSLDVQSVVLAVIALPS